MTKHLFFLILMLFVITARSQDNIDSLLNALPEAKDTLRLQAIDKILTKVRGTNKTLAQQLINEEYELAAIIKNEKVDASVHNSNAILKYFNSELDSALFFFKKSLSLFEKIDAKERIAAVCNNIGILYENKGEYELAIEYNLQSLKIKEELGNKKGIANTKYSMASLWLELGDPEKAKSLLLEAKEIYESVKNTDGVNDVYLGLASVASLQERYRESTEYYLKALAYYMKIDDHYMVMTAYYNLGSSYYKLDILDSALYYHHLALPMANEFEDLDMQASLNRGIGDVYSAQGKHMQALPLLKKAVEQFAALGYKDQLLDSYQWLYQGEVKAGQFEAAYNNFQNFVLLRDSIASKKMQTDIVELETKYESEKKEKELVISRAENDKKQARIRLLGTGLISLLLLFLALYYAMRQRMIKNKLEKEKIALELKDAAQQLEFKKKELTAKVLQLAKKNEFLQELETEVAELQSSIDTSVGKTSSRISRMIQRDTNDDAEWEQFGKEFSSVNVGFIDKLKANYGAFSQSEMRLVSLLKMNLTSKEIANILRISDEGIKKARYRLRKKMGLEKGEDLQGVILSL